MGFKKINGFWLIQAGVMTGTATITSAAQNVQNFDNIGLEIAWTGTPTGTISIQGSVTESISGAIATYYDLTFDPVITQPAGSAGGYLININQFPWPYLRFKYVNASGTGALNVYLFSKDIN